MPKNQHDINVMGLPGVNYYRIWEDDPAHPGGKRPASHTKRVRRRADVRWLGWMTTSPHYLAVDNPDSVKGPPVQVEVSFKFGQSPFGTPNLAFGPYVPGSNPPQPPYVQATGSAQAYLYKVRLPGGGWQDPDIIIDPDRGFESVLVAIARGPSGEILASVGQTGPISPGVKVNWALAVAGDLPVTSFLVDFSKKESGSPFTDRRTQSDPIESLRGQLETAAYRIKDTRATTPQVYRYDLRLPELDFTQFDAALEVLPAEEGPAMSAQAPAKPAKKATKKPGKKAAKKPTKKPAKKAAKKAARKK